MTCQDANTGIKVQVSSKAANIAFGMVTSGTGNTRTIVISTNTTGSYLFRIWLVDGATDTEITQQPPSEDQTVVWFKETNTSGSLTQTVVHNGTQDWYLKAVLIGPVGTSDILEFT